ncbi:MAG: head GIN domain-containing protein [Ginsengibacter sp.]
MRNIIILTAMALTVCSCNVETGSGNIISENRQVGSFEGVQASGSIDVNVQSGPEDQVVIEADDNILKYIITEVDNGVLEIHYKSNTNFRNTHITAHVIGKDLNRLYVSGSGNIKVTNIIKNDDRIQVKVSGSGDISAILDVPKVEAESSGSGNITLRGKCKNFEADMSGSGDLKSSELLAENADVSIAGSGTASVHCSVKLKARASGSGSIYYSGNPQDQQINKSGSGSVEKR